jgi:DivIVA domain-containing protein
MELSPQAVRATSFKTVKKGYDPDEVEAFRDDAAAAIEAAQNQAAAMEARARAAVAKLQEASQQAAAAPAHAEPATVVASADDAETISRTLLLAQRTADTTVAEARAEADAILASARAEAAATLDSARTMSARLIDEARVEARRAGEDELLRSENEVQALLAKRDFLLSDADHLEQYIVTQRDRVRDVAVALHELVERVPGGLGDARRPILSASAETAKPAAPVVEPVPAPAPLAVVVESPVAAAAAPEFAVDEPAVETTPPALDSLLQFSLDVTAEVPVIPPREEPRFRIGGDELQ